MGERLQFERQGYFFRDPVDSRPHRLVFNRIVPLRDSWALETQKKVSPAALPPKPAEPKAPKVVEEKAAEPLSEEEIAALEEMRPRVQPIVDDVLAAHPGQVEQYRKGKMGLLGFLIAQVMKRVTEGGGAASPKLVSVLVREAVGSS
jgi:glutaminyl-tRNA synthetase